MGVIIILIKKLCDIGKPCGLIDTKQYMVWCDTCVGVTLFGNIVLFYLVCEDAWKDRKF